MPRILGLCVALVGMVSILVTKNAAASITIDIPHATADGIAYRSNLIDPRNPYSSDEGRNFSILLARLGLVSDWTDIGGSLAHPTPDEVGSVERVAHVGSRAYPAFLRVILTPHRIEDFIPPDPDGGHDGYRLFNATNAPDAAVRYMKALTAAHPPHEMRAKLIAARHNLSLEPSEDEQDHELNLYLDALKTIEGERWRPWRDYLEGAAYFYAEDYDSAADAFARIPQTNTWLGATSAYMQVRIAFRNVEARRWAHFWSGNEDDIGEEMSTQLAHLSRAIEDFRRSGLDHGYLNTVLDLRRFVAWVGRNRARVRNVFIDEIGRYFGPDSQMPRSLREMFFVELIRRDIWEMLLGAAEDSPLWQINRLLVALARADDAEQSSAPGEEDMFPTWVAWTLPSAVLTVEDMSALLSESLASRKAAFDAYPGLYTYGRALLAFAERDYQDVVAAMPEATDAGPFLPDILLLKARSHSAMGDNWAASMIWREIAVRWPVLNAPTEAARAAVKADRFGDFASLEWDVSLRSAPDDDPTVADEWNPYRRELADPAGFLEHERPIRRLLRDGLARFTDLRKNIDIARDASVSWLVRWYALEPVLRAALLQGDYPAYVALGGPLMAISTHVTDTEQRALAERYSDLLPSVRTLTRDPDHAESLMNVGNFLYAGPFFPVCTAEAEPLDGDTLWSRKLGACKRHGYAGNADAAPIALFDRARAAFQTRESRADAEARLLRTMIHCYRGRQNHKSCVRKSTIGTERRTRARWFFTLHRYFPEAAEKTPYWY